MFQQVYCFVLNWLFVFTLVGLAIAEEPLRKIGVTASINNEVPVTNVDYSLTVKLVKPTLVEAKKEVDAAVAKLRQRLSVLPADMLTIQSPSLDQGRDYDYENNKKIFVGYFVERSLSIELKDYTLLDRLETILAESQDFSLSSRSFTNKDQVQLRHDARKSALEAALRKARSMAAVLEMNIGMPLEISEGSWHAAGPSSVVGLNIPFTQGGFTEAAATKAKGNTITISAEVNVVFELKPAPAK